MKVVMAPDKFAGTMTATEAAAAMRRGWLAARPADEVLTAPMADGGPGTVDCLAAFGAGTIRTSTVGDPLGRPVEARWLACGTTVAVLEAASAVGLHLIEPSERDPIRASSAGLGELIRAVMDQGFDDIVVGLGGTGTVDGGAGMATALGASLSTAQGEDLEPVPVHLAGVRRVSPIERRPARIRLASDVTNPLLGPTGASRVFGPQKGADAACVERLEEALTALADAVEDSLGGSWRHAKGAGAGGGIGFALMAWAGAEWMSGAAYVAEATGLTRHVAWADLVVTGEGSLDSQSVAGKVPAHVLELARRAGTEAAAVAGRIDAEMGSLFDHAIELGTNGLTDPIGRTEHALATLARRFR